MSEPVAHPNFWPRFWIGVAIWAFEKATSQRERSGTYELHAGDVLREIDEFRETHHPDIEIRKFP